MGVAWTPLLLGCVAVAALGWCMASVGELADMLDMSDEEFLGMARGSIGLAKPERPPMPTIPKGLYNLSLIHI